MRPDIANALGMIAMLATTFGLVIFLGKIHQPVPWGKRIAYAFLAGFLILVFSSIGLGYKCPSYFTTGNRSYWLAICGIVIALFVINKKLISLTCILIIVFGFKLNLHYAHLVNSNGNYGYLGENGRGYNCACPDESSVGVKLRPLWHSQLTEIYSVESTAVVR